MRRDPPSRLQADPDVESPRGLAPHPGTHTRQNSAVRVVLACISPAPGGGSCMFMTAQHTYTIAGAL
jgi:hypothetical protein